MSYLRAVARGALAGLGFLGALGAAGLVLDVALDRQATPSTVQRPALRLVQGGARACSS